MKQIDERGNACPIPVVHTKKALESMDGETKLIVLVDNEPAVQNVTRFAEGKNCEVTSEKISEKEYKIEILTDNYTAGDSEEEINCIPAEKKDDFVIVVSSNEMGQGEKALGQTLIKAFLFAVTKQDQLPSKMLFYNSGAYLTCEGSDSLEDLKTLEAEGVEIYTCGTCLNFYELTEKLAVGSITNMYDIVEMMEQAGKVIKP